MNRNSIIYVAGATGLVGSAIVRYLKANGYKNVHTKRINLLSLEEVGTYFCLNKIEYVFMAGAKVGGIKANLMNPVAFFEENVIIQNNIIKSAWQFEIKKIIFLGSSCIYPKHCPQPIREEYLMEGKLEETNEAYALAKIAGIKLLDYYYQEYGLKSLKVMPCNLYGPNDKFDENGHVLAGLVKKFCDSDEVTIWGDGSARREFLWVDDFVNILMMLLEEYDSQEIINVGSGYDLKISELAEIIINELKWKGTVRYDPNKPKGVYQKVLDIYKLRNTIKYPQILSIQEGVRNMINIYKGTFT